MEPNLFEIMKVNMGYAGLGSVMTLVSMLIGYKLFDAITPFITGDELKKGNLAVGVVIGSIFMSLGIAVGLVVGMSLN